MEALPGQKLKYYIDVYNTDNMPQKRGTEASQARRANRILHYPRLDTVMMIEDAIRDAKEYPSKRQLWLSLKRKVMYQTFLVVIDYLEHCQKIVMNRGKIIWIWNPELVKKYMSKPHLIAR
jgi:hypothetical protein